MAKLPKEVKIAIDKAETACIATVDSNGVPNVVYISYMKYQDDETIIIADNKFVKTRKNIDNNQKLAFVVLDSDTNKSYQIKGIAKTYLAGEEYQSVVDWVHVKHPEMTAKAALYVQADEIYCGGEQIG